MKTLQLTKFYPPVRGGIETVSYELTTGLNACGVETDVLCANLSRRTVREQGPHQEHIVRAGSLGRFLSTSISPALIWELFKRRSNYDIIHVQLPDPMACLALWLTRPKSKIILHWQSDVVNQRLTLKLFQPLQKWVLKRADIISTSSAAYAEHSPWLKPFSKKITPLPLGIQEPATAPLTQTEAIRAKYPNRKIVFALGRMTYYKGFNILIDCAARLNDDVIVLVGGGGELLETYRKEVRERGIERRISFLGPLSEDDARAHMAGCDVFCLPSIVRAEAFGVVLIEAMAAERPVIATNIPGSGVPWVNQHGVTGINVPVSDPIALAEAINTLMADEELRKRLGAGGRRRFETQFLATHMVDRAIKLYRQMLELSDDVG